MKKNFDERLEAEIRMMCSFYFHKEMAKTAQRAKEQEGFWLDAIEKIKFLTESYVDESSRKEGSSWRLAIGHLNTESRQSVLRTYEAIKKDLDIELISQKDCRACNGEAGLMHSCAKFR